MNDRPLLPNLPHHPGVYLMRDAAARIIYIGKARDLKKRVASYFVGAEGGDAGAKNVSLVPLIRHVDYIPTASEREALILERRLIGRYQPTFNVMWKDDKSYPYVVLTMGEDFPRVFLTRKRKRDGSLYFGPYPSVSRVRQLLKWAWRKKLFPLRACDLEIEEGKPYAYEDVKSCLYLHTGQCPAPCLGRISSARYGRIAQRARLFFQGKHDALIGRFEKEMAAAAKRTEYERAAEIRDRIETLRHMQEPVTVRELSEADLAERVSESRSVQDLMRRLGMPRPPNGIECFDISHIQGVEKVASMVRFDGGRPNKSQYRKYIIRTVEGIDDFKAMAEVVERRYRRLRDEKKPLPDLVVIDGGKGQLSSALAALKKTDIRGIFVAALAKEEEEVFLPGRKDSLRLPEDSAGLLLLRRVRDEAHRFAIKFHRQRRSKRTLGG